MKRRGGKEEGGETRVERREEDTEEEAGTEANTMSDARGRPWKRGEERRIRREARADGAYGKRQSDGRLKMRAEMKEAQKNKVFKRRTFLIHLQQHISPSCT